MTTAAAERADLDRELVLTGQDATLQRIIVATQATISVAVRAHVVDYKPHQIPAGTGLQAGDSHVIMSSTEVDAAAWPSVSESRIPRRGDRFIVGGRTRIVQNAWPAPYVGGELVRIEMQIR